MKRLTFRSIVTEHDEASEREAGSVRNERVRGGEA